MQALSSRVGVPQCTIYNARMTSQAYVISPY
jgi:hypothetical protein